MVFCKFLKDSFFHTFMNTKLPYDVKVLVVFVFIHLSVFQCVCLTFFLSAVKLCGGVCVHVCVNVYTHTLRLAGQGGKGQCDEFRNDRKQ